MINGLLYRITAGLPTRLIALDSGPYLERYYVGRLFGATFYLHRFVGSGSERHIHNHPWTWGRSLVMSGAYLEEVVADISAHGCVTYDRWVRLWNVVNGAHFHRIKYAERKTWTLFFHGPRAAFGVGPDQRLKGWGFLHTRAGVRRGVMFTPAESGQAEWWKTAPLGRDSGRQPDER